MSDENAIEMLAQMRNEYSNLDDGAVVTQFSRYGGGIMPRNIRLKYKVDGGAERQSTFYEPDSWSAHSGACILMAYLDLEPDDSVGEESNHRIPVTSEDRRIKPDFDTMLGRCDVADFPDWQEAKEARESPDEDEKEETVREAITILRELAEDSDRPPFFPTHQAHVMAYRLSDTFDIEVDQDDSEGDGDD